MNTTYLKMPAKNVPYFTEICGGIVAISGPTLPGNKLLVRIEDSLNSPSILRQLAAKKRPKTPLVLRKNVRLAIPPTSLGVFEAIAGRPHTIQPSDGHLVLRYYRVPRPVAAALLLAENLTLLRK